MRLWRRQRRLRLRTAWRACAGAIAALAVAPAGASAAASTNAGGAPLGDLLLLGLLLGSLFGAFAALAQRHRSGRGTILHRSGRALARATGLPAWAALPAVVTVVSSFCAVTGFYWDVGVHVDDGRDPGPLTVAPHWPTLLGLSGVALGGALALVMGPRERRPTFVRLARGWFAPLGGILVLVCGTIAVIAFPVDDVWHRVFGQDVTVWGPVHLLLINGGGLSMLGVWMLLVEGRDWAEAHGLTVKRRLVWAMEAGVGGGLLVAVSDMQAEFDFGVPQFPLLNHPVLLVVCAALVLTAVRVRLGRGGALAAIAAFLLIRVFLTLLVGPVLGHVTPHLYPYVVEALCVELIALIPASRQPVAFGALAGLAIGTVGVVAAWAWSNVWMPVPWPGALVGEALQVTCIAGPAAGALGAMIGAALDGRAAPWGALHPRTPVVVIALAVVAVCLAYPVPKRTDSDTHGTVTLSRVHDGRAQLTLRLEPRGAAERADWLSALAWQGGAPRVLDPLVRIGPGEYRSTQAIPISGAWKSGIRLHRGRTMVALPLHFPADPAIGARAIAPPHGETRAFVSEKDLLRREAKASPNAGFADSLKAAVAVIALFWISAFGWSLRRMRRRGAPGARQARLRRRRARRPAMYRA